MNTKQIRRMTVDALMMILITILMAYMITGEKLHEILGTVTLVLFILHHLLNKQWIKGVFKGPGTPERILGISVYILLCLDMIGLAVSSVMISGFVFSFLHIQNGLVLGRQVHMLTTYWGFLLMAAHLGLNWSMIAALIRKAAGISSKSAVRTRVLRVLVILISIWGGISFFQENFPTYLFLRTAFILFNEQPPVLFFASHLSVMILFAAVFYYINQLLKRNAGRRN